MSDTPIYDETVNEHSQPMTVKPQPKVIAATTGAGVGSAIGVILTWVIEASTGIDIPEGVELAIGVVLTTGLAFIGGYWKKN